MCSTILVLYWCWSSILYLGIILKNVFQHPCTILVFGPQYCIWYYLKNMFRHSYIKLFLESTPVYAVHPGDCSPPHPHDHWSVTSPWLADHRGQHCGCGQDWRGPEKSVEHAPSGMRVDLDGVLCGQVTEVSHPPGGQEEVWDKQSGGQTRKSSNSKGQTSRV